MSFKPGDVVVLKGNVHPLTVKTTSGEKITVVWFDSFWKLHQEQFTADLLEYKDLQSQRPVAAPSQVEDTSKKQPQVSVEDNPRKRS